MQRHIGILAFLVLAACGGGEAAPAPPAAGPVVRTPLAGAPILVLANGRAAAPVAWDASQVDLSELGITPADVAGTFRFTTPAGTWFRLELATTNAALCVALAGGGDDIGALTEAGIFHATKGGGTFEGPWFKSDTAEVARIEIGGRIDAPQVLVVRALDTYALVRLDIGDLSLIHPADSGVPDAALAVDDVVTSSSDDLFERPAIASLLEGPVVSWFGGDDTVQANDVRYHMRARVEAPRAAGAMMADAGSALASAGDAFALFFVRVEGGTVTVESSSSAGASYEVSQVVDGAAPVRHPVLAIQQHVFALVYWRGRDLVLVEGTYPPLSLQPEEVLWTAPDGALLQRPAVRVHDGDIAVAFAHGQAQLDEGLADIDVSTDYHVWRRRAGGVAEQNVVARVAGLRRGPSLARTPAGAWHYVLEEAVGLRHYEVRADGSYRDAGTFGTPGAHSPRATGTAVCYLQPTARGREVHCVRDNAQGQLEVERLTAASRGYRDRGPAWARSFPVYTPNNVPVPWIGFGGRQIAPDGFDVALDPNGGLHVVCHEERNDRYFFMRIEPGRNINFIGSREVPVPPVYAAPPAGPEIVSPLGGANVFDRHRLRFLTLD